MYVYSFNFTCDPTTLKTDISSMGISNTIDHIETSANPEKTHIYFLSELTDVHYIKLKNLIEKHNKPIPDNVSVNQFNAYHPPFGSKILPDGSKIFRRVRSVSKSVQNEGSNIDFIVPFNHCKITGLQILNGKLGDKATFQVLDNDQGTISGIPNSLLNTFGTDVFIAPENANYPSKYDADLFLGMVLRLIYDPTDELLPRTIYVNFDLHEVISA